MFMEKPRRVRVGKTAWHVLRCFVENNGRGSVTWGARYAELEPGRCRIFSQGYHGLFAQGLLTRKGLNAPHQAAITDRGVVAYLTGSIASDRPSGPFLDEFRFDPYAGTVWPIPLPDDHKWAREHSQNVARNKRAQG